MPTGILQKIKYLLIHLDDLDNFSLIILYYFNKVGASCPSMSNLQNSVRCNLFMSFHYLPKIFITLTCTEFYYYY